MHKELHPSGEYAKGKGIEFEAWRKATHSCAMWVPVACASGSRQDIDFDGCVPIYANRMIILEFLVGLVNVPGHSNILETCIWRSLRCNEIVAQLRANTLWQIIITDPMRWLAGKSSKALSSWSIVSSNDVLDMAYKAFEAIAADGHALLDPLLDPFAAIADKQPAFAKWRAEWQEQPPPSPPSLSLSAHTHAHFHIVTLTPSIHV